MTQDETLNHDLKVGDTIIYTRDGRPTVMTVWKILDAGTAGTSRADGPRIMAHTRPGGFGMSFDSAGLRSGFFTIEKAPVDWSTPSERNHHG